MRSLRLTAVLVLAVTSALSACGPQREEERTVPDVRVQGGEALQVEVDPAGAGPRADTAAAGAPGATSSPADSL